MSFAYDANGRAVKAAKTNTPDAISVYDAAGQKVAERVSDVWKFCVYDVGGKVVAEYGGVQSVNEGGVKYPFRDWQGSTRAITSNSGFVQARQDFTAFGEEIGAGVGQRTSAQGFDAANTLNQKYAQTERDQASGLDNTWFRKLENKAGRWTSPDPYNGSMNIGDPQSLNRYAYVNNDPINFIDPSGLNASSGGICLTFVHGTRYEFPNGTIVEIPQSYSTTCFGGGGGGSYSPSGSTGGFGGGSGGGNETGSPQQEEKKDICKWFESFLSNPLISEFFQKSLDKQKDSGKEQGGLIGWFKDSSGADPLRTSFDNKNGDERNLGKENTGEFLNWAKNIISNTYPNANFSIFWHTHNNTTIPSEGDINVNNQLSTTWGMILKPGSASLFGREGEEICKVEFPVS